MRCGDVSSSVCLEADDVPQHTKRPAAYTGSPSHHVAHYCMSPTARHQRHRLAINPSTRSAAPRLAIHAHRTRHTASSHKAHDVLQRTRHTTPSDTRYTMSRTAHTPHHVALHTLHAVLHSAHSSSSMLHTVHTAAVACCTAHTLRGEVRREGWGGIAVHAIVSFEIVSFPRGVGCGFCSVSRWRLEVLFPRKWSREGWCCMQYCAMHSLCCRTRHCSALLSTPLRLRCSSAFSCVWRVILRDGGVDSIYSRCSDRAAAAGCGVQATRRWEG